MVCVEYLETAAGATPKFVAYAVTKMEYLETAADASAFHKEAYFGCGESGVPGNCLS